MAEDGFAIGSVQRSTLYHVQRLNEVRAEATRRLGTGREVNEVRDSPADYLRAQALAARISNLHGVKADIGRGIDALAASQVGLEAVQKFSEQLKGIAIAAQSADTTNKAELVQQFDRVRSQLDLLVGDISYQGVNLLDNPADSLRVNISDGAGQEFAVAGQASDANGLGLGTAATTFNSFATQADIDAAILAVESAISSARANEARIGSNAAILEVRENFTDDLANTLQAGVDSLINADLTKEALKALTSGVREGLAQEGARITADSERQLAALVAGA
jgi:flagellin